jgi:hypothetical protein
MLKSSSAERSADDCRRDDGQRALNITRLTDQSSRLTQEIAALLGDGETKGIP